MSPQILEFNFAGDSTRGCKHYPDYFNDVFTALFLDNPAHRAEKEIVIV